MKGKSLLQSTICIVSGVMLLLAGCSSQERGDLEAVTAAVNDIWNILQEINPSRFPVRD